LHAAGQLLGQLEDVTQAAREAITRTEAEASAAKENRTSSSKQDQSISVNLQQKMEDILGKAHERLNTVAGNFLVETGGGLSYRIERSRFYVQQFEDNVKLLRIQRLEGAQPYDQFIRRRLGSEFDFIDRLGIRYERATRAMETLDQSHLATIQTKIDQDTNSIQVNIQRIQEWGEFALLAALVPYYVAHLLDLIIAEKYVMTTTVIVWTVSAAFAFYRLTNRLWPSLVIILAILGLVNLQNHFDYSWLLRSHGAPDEHTQKPPGGDQKKDVAPAPKADAPAPGPATPLPKG